MTFYPPVSFHFAVSFNGIASHIIDSQFQSVSGLSVEMETETYAEGGENRFTHILPVRAKYSNLTLARGLFKDSAIIEWCVDTFESGIVKPISLDIFLLDEQSAPLFSWNVSHAWPKKWSVSDLHAENNAIAIETHELHYRYFRTQ